MLPRTQDLVSCPSPPPSRLADCHISAGMTMVSCSGTGHTNFGRLLKMKQMWSNAYYIIIGEIQRKSKDVGARNVQKVLKQGYVKIFPVSVVLEVVPYVYPLNFLVKIVVVSKWFSVTGKAHHSILPLRVGVVVTNHGKTSNTLMIQVGFTLL